MANCPPRRLDLKCQRWEMAYPIVIAGHVMATIGVVEVTISEHGFAGRGEAAGVFYFGDTPESLATTIEAVRGPIEDAADRAEIARLLPAGGARNAVDCALWELDSYLQNRSVWQVAGLTAPQPLLTTMTIGADDPASVGARAKDACHTAQAIKLKLNGDGADAERVRTLRQARADVWIGVDANQSLDGDGLADLLPTLVDCRVSLIEQPCRVGSEELLRNLGSPIPLAADESAQSIDDLERLVGLFDFINIKLDKCGGLTAALEMTAAARLRGFGVMVGNMGGTSLAMAPGFLAAQGCSVVDLDGPIYLKRDRNAPVTYDNGYLDVPPKAWGFAS